MHVQMALQKLCSGGEMTKGPNRTMSWVQSKKPKETFGEGAPRRGEGRVGLVKAAVYETAVAVATSGGVQ